MQVTLDAKEEQYTQRGKPTEKLDKLHLWEEDADKVLKIGFKLQGEVREKLIELLKTSKDIFAG